VDFTLAYPERVTGLVLVGAVVSGMGYTDHMYNRGGHVTLADVTDPQHALIYWSERDPYEIAPQNEVAHAKVRRLLEANPQNLDDAKDRLRQPPQRAALKILGEIRVPTLVVVGEYDIPDVHAHAGALEAGIPGARRVILSGAGHLVPLEQPAAFNRAVLGFLLGRNVAAAIEAGRIDEARRQLIDLRARHPDVEPFTEGFINQAGYRALQGGKVDDAVALFTLYVDVYPDSWNAYDSLGEAYAAKGDTEQAIRAYRKSLELNPSNENGRQALERLSAGAPRR
jgi:tetratricopeptide (TPR) repeat protein